MDIAGVFLLTSYFVRFSVILNHGMKYLQRKILFWQERDHKVCQHDKYISRGNKEEKTYRGITDSTQRRKNYEKLDDTPERLSILIIPLSFLIVLGLFDSNGNCSGA